MVLHSNSEPAEGKVTRSDQVAVVIQAHKETATFVDPLTLSLTYFANPFISLPLVETGLPLRICDKEQTSEFIIFNLISSS